MHPSKGIIPGKGSVNIEISYTPSVNNTIDVDLEVKNYLFIIFYFFLLKNLKNLKILKIY